MYPCTAQVHSAGVQVRACRAQRRCGRRTVPPLSEAHRAGSKSAPSPTRPQLRKLTANTAVGWRGAQRSRREPRAGSRMGRGSGGSALAGGRSAGSARDSRASGEKPEGEKKGRGAGVSPTLHSVWGGRLPMRGASVPPSPLMRTARCAPARRPRLGLLPGAPLEATHRRCCLQREHRRAAAKKENVRAMARNRVVVAVCCSGHDCARAALRRCCGGIMRGRHGPVPFPAPELPERRVSALFEFGPVFLHVLGFLPIVLPHLLVCPPKTHTTKPVQ